MRELRLLAATWLVAGSALAQGPGPVPPALQAATFEKIFAFDRTLGDRARLKVLLVYGHDPEADGKETAEILQRAFLAASIAAEPVPLVNAVGRLQPGVVVYLLAGAATPELLKAAAGAHVLTIAGEAGLVEQGKASVGLGARGEKAEIVVNLDRVAQEGHDFSAQLLKFARLVHGGADTGATTAAPVLVALSKPAYPELARRLRLEGDVVMRLSVDENGKVTAVELVRGLGRGGVDEAALAAARLARFRPATRNGVAVQGTYLLTMPFRL